MSLKVGCRFDSFDKYPFFVFSIRNGKNLFYFVQIAKTMGADVIFNTTNLSIPEIKARILKETDGNGPGNVIECTGAPPIVNGCFSFVRKGDWQFKCHLDVVFIIFRISKTKKKI